MSHTNTTNTRESFIEKYHYAIDRNPGAHFVDTLLRGAGQVMFQNNPLTGLVILVGIFWAEYSIPHSPPVGWGAMIALVTGTVTAMVLGVDRKSITNGLYGFNAILVGIALSTFLQWNVILVVYLILGAIISTIVMTAISSAFTNWGITAMTFPFVLTTWFFLLAAYFFIHLLLVNPGVPALPTSSGINTLLRPDRTSLIDGNLSWFNLIQSLFRGVSQVFLMDNLVTGILFVIALLISSRLAALYALVGSAVGFIIALLLGGDGYSIYHGLYGYNSVLGTIAVGSVYFVASWKTAIYAILCAILCTIVAGALLALLEPFGMPTLTAAFVFSTWLFVLPKPIFRHLVPTRRHAHTHGPPAVREREETL